MAPPSSDAITPAQSPELKTCQLSPISLDVAPPQPATTVPFRPAIAEIDVHVTGWPSSTFVQCGRFASSDAVFQMPPLAVATSQLSSEATRTAACAAPADAIASLSPSFT